MQVYEIKDGSGRIFAFEVDNGLLGRQAVIRIIERLPQAKLLKVPKLFSWFREDVFCKFEIMGHLFLVLEPFGDNSRYWIGPQDNAWYKEIDIIRDAFVKHRPGCGVI